MTRVGKGAHESAGASTSQATQDSKDFEATKSKSGSTPPAVHSQVP